MSVPNTNTFSLNDVRLELGLGTTASLTDCFTAACASGFDPTYEGSKNSLSNFRNYNDSACVACVAVTLRYSSSSSSGACSSIPFTYYGNANNLSGLSVVYTNSNCTAIGSVGWYSDGTIWKYFNGASFTSNGFCI